MPQTAFSTASSQDQLTRFQWRPMPEGWRFINRLVETMQAGSPAIAGFARRLHQRTGTRLVDWVDHFELPATEETAGQLNELGFHQSLVEGRQWYTHPGALFPRIVLHNEAVQRLFISVESVADFLAANELSQHATIDGDPGAAVRSATIASENGIEWVVIERHGSLGDQPTSVENRELAGVLRHHEAFRLRKRTFDDDRDGFEHAESLFRAAAADLGVDRACDLFFAAEREYWQRRNRAGRVQKAQQDSLGVGWANHDHHTYRASRCHFVRLIAALGLLGFTCRERFYAGREAGWGAQVLEHATTGVVIFADVDLSPDEVAADFAHDPLPDRDTLGTVGLWCRLHGEAFLQAGMHHLECRFDFDAARDQLAQAGVATMKPFTDLPYLRQAFTEGEVWRVRRERVDPLLREGLITAEQAEQFRSRGALGSHLEILQRDDGYRGFNQSGINEIIRDTDPRRLPPEHTGQ